MEKYIGVKLIVATPMDAKEFSDETGKVVSGEEGYKVVYEEGYISWSPKDVFEKAYRKISELTFGLALEALKLGKKVARKGWNGKGMFVYFIPANRYPFSTDIGKSIADEDGKVYYNPYLAIKNVDGTVSTWVPSVNDCISEDWTILD